MERPSVSGTASAIQTTTILDLILQFEPLLRKLEYDYGLKITNVKEEAGCEIGDNYMSVVMQTTVEGLRGDGTSYRKSFMTKYLPSHREMTKIFRTGDLFENEIHVYDKLLPILGNFGPICIYTDAKKIIMQDLKVMGYVVLNRRDLLDFDHCVSSLQILARLHASSLSLKLKNPTMFLELMKPLKECVFTRETTPAIGGSIDASVKNAIKHLESINPRSNELEEGIEFLRSYEGRVFTEMQDLVDPGKGKFDVLTHGDCWNNNIMFKHDAGGKILDVKLLDFQITRHCSPALDFHYFIYSSSKSSVIEERYDDLVKAYFSELSKNMKEKSGLPHDLLSQLDFKWFKNELKAHAKYGLFTGCWIVNAILADETDVVDLDNLTLKDFEDFGKREEIIIPKVAERLKSIVTNYVRRYISESC